MEQATPKPLVPGRVERWALLIGIDYYFDGSHRAVTLPSLRGCVRDVQAVEQYLKRIKVPEGNIMKLTASKGPCGIMEEESAWPTRNNIVEKLDKILHKAKHGALMYIHYSGHGILRRNIADQPDEDGNRFTGAALVPTDVKQGGAYLSAYQLGAKIKSMIENKEMRITLVLDCCHSGRGIRGGDLDPDDGNDVDEQEEEDENSSYESVRGIDEEDESMLESDRAADLEADRQNGGHRGVEVARPSWLEHPRSCTILTACGVEEKAREILFKTGRNGALTYWMLKVLDCDSTRPHSYATIRDHVAQSIATSSPRVIQTPGVLGDTYREFFGQHILPWMPSSRVLKKNDEYVLDIGKAQGVASGATYELRPEVWDASHNEAPNAFLSGAHLPFQLCISDVFDLRSKAKPVLEQDREAIDRLIGMGRRAVLHRWALPSKTVIKVVSALTTPGTSYLDRFRASLQEELRTTHNLVLDSSGLDAKEDFLLAVDSQNTVEIQNREGKPLPWLPTLPLPHSGTIDRLADLLRHIARFQAIRDLRYGAPLPANRLVPERFKLVAYDENRVLLPKAASGDFMAIKNQRVQVEFTVEQGSEPVYVTIFHLTDQFGILKRFPPQGQLPYEVHKSDTDPIYVSGRMTIPSGREDNHTEVKDTMRAYVYRGSRVPSWSELELHEVLMERDIEAGDGSEGDRGHDENKAYGEDGHWAVMDCTIVTLP